MPKSKISKKVKVFWCSAPPAWEKSPSGDADFVEQMVASLTENGVQSEWVKGISKLSDGSNLYGNEVNVNFSHLIGHGDAKQKAWEDYYLTKKGDKSVGRTPKGTARIQSVQNIARYIKENTPADCEPVFHLTIRPPDTGYMVSPTDLKWFKSRGIKVVVTCHEYSLNNLVDRDHFNDSALTYFKEADQVVFLNKRCYFKALKDSEKLEAKHGQKSIYVTSESLKEKSTTASIPVTVPIDEKDKQSIADKLQRDPNILVFGNFRRLKGFEEACRTAIVAHAVKNNKWNEAIPSIHPKTTLLKHLGNPDKAQQKLLQKNLAKTKVIFAGSINPAFPHVYRQIIQTLIDYPDSIEVHPDPTKLTLPGEKKPIGLVGLVALCDTKHRKELESIRKQTFISNKDLATLAKKCKYAYKGDQTGMRDNASGIISTLEQGCITYCQEHIMTDKCYKAGGQYEHAVIMDSTNAKGGIRPGFPKSNNLLKDIAGREVDQSKFRKKGTVSQNERTLRSMEQLLDERFRKKAVFNRHKSVYGALTKTKAKSSKRKSDSAAKGRYTFVEKITDPKAKSGNKILLVKDNEDGKQYILKRGKKEENSNSVIMSAFLKRILKGQKATVAGKKYKIHIPVIEKVVVDGVEYQKQEFLQNLTPDINGKSLHGLISTEGIKDAAEIGAVLQFFMMGDNIVKNIRISDSNHLSIFDFDRAFTVHDHHTSKQGIFHDSIKPGTHNNIWNKHLFDILALRFGHDRTPNKDNIFVHHLKEDMILASTNENWKDFFQGTLNGLKRINDNLGLDKFKKVFDFIDGRARDDVRTIFIKRFETLGLNIRYLEALISGKESLIVDGTTIDMNTKISQSFEHLNGKENSQFVDALLEATGRGLDKFAKKYKPKAAKASKKASDKKWKPWEWLPEARELLRERLGLKEGETSTHSIKKRKEDNFTFGRDITMSDAEKEDFLKRSAPYSKDNRSGCGTTDYDTGQNYPFCHFRFTHDTAAKTGNDEDPRIKIIPEEEYMRHEAIAAVCIEYPNHANSKILPSHEKLKAIYRGKTLETLRSYSDLGVDHLIKCGDGMGVFLDRIYERDKKINRKKEDVEAAMASYLDGFFEAILEFYRDNPGSGLKRITFMTIDTSLTKIFTDKLAEFKKSLSKKEMDAFPKISCDRAGTRFRTEEYFSQGSKKIGLTIAPHESYKFLGGVLNQGSVLEEQIAALSDMASIGNPDFNPKVKTKVSLQDIGQHAKPPSSESSLEHEEDREDEVSNFKNYIANIAALQGDKKAQQVLLDNSKDTSINLSDCKQELRKHCQKKNEESKGYGVKEGVESKKFRTPKEGSFVGIKSDISKIKYQGRTLLIPIFDVIPGSPAQKMGLKGKTLSFTLPENYECDLNNSEDFDHAIIDVVSHIRNNGIQKGDPYVKIDERGVTALIDTPKYKMDKKGVYKVDDFKVGSLEGVKDLDKDLDYSPSSSITSSKVHGSTTGRSSSL